MNIAIFTSLNNTMSSLFVSKYSDLLKEKGVYTKIIITDINGAKSDSLIKHMFKIAQRQAVIAKTNWIHQTISIIFYKLACKIGFRGVVQANSIENIRQVSVNTINSSETIKYVNSENIDVVLLMGSRIIRKDILESLASAEILNIHASDPSFVRGGPPIFWEIFGKRNNLKVTIHEVVPELDAGKVIAQIDVPIVYKRTYGGTLSGTLHNMRQKGVDLFYSILIDRKAYLSQQGIEGLGPIMVTPNVFQVIKVMFYCFLKSN